MAGDFTPYSQKGEKFLFLLIKVSKVRFLLEFLNTSDDASGDVCLVN